MEEQRKELFINITNWMNLQIITSEKNPNPKVYMLYNSISIYITLLK